MRVYEGGVLVHGAHSIGIAVRGDAIKTGVGFERGHQVFKVGHDRFGMDAAKTGVHLAADLDSFAASRLQHAHNKTPAGTVHRIHDYFLGSFADHVKIDECVEVLFVGRIGTETLDEPLRHGVVVIHQPGAAAAGFVVIQVDLHPFAHGIGGRAAIRR